jgi:hypothetical protein
LPSLTAPLRVHIFNYVGKTQDELINLTLVSKQFYKDCKRPGIESKIIPTIEISASQHHDDNSSIRARLLMHNLRQHLRNNETKEKLQCYPRMRNCPLLEKVTYHNTNNASQVYLNGYGMQSSNNLKEIHMND